MLIFFEFVISWKDLELTGFFFRNPTTDMSSAAANDVKTAVPIFDGSNYNVWVDQMKFWLQSQCYDLVDLHNESQVSRPFVSFP